MSEPKFKVGDTVEVNINWRTPYPAKWEQAVVQQVSTTIPKTDIPLAKPIYFTNKGAFQENAVRALPET